MIKNKPMATGTASAAPITSWRASHLNYASSSVEIRGAVRTGPGINEFFDRVGERLPIDLYHNVGLGRFFFAASATRKASTGTLFLL